MDMIGSAAFKDDHWKWQRDMVNVMITGLDTANMGITFVLARVFPPKKLSI